jgi:glycosyltransferase involved in cell wall biosynthesis
MRRLGSGLRFSPVGSGLPSSVLEVEIGGLTPRTEPKTEGLTPKPTPEPKTEGLAPEPKTEGLTPEPKTEGLTPRTPRIVRTFLPVHELGGGIPSRGEARGALGLGEGGNVALFFGHVRPFKGLDLALRAWRLLTGEATLLVAGEVWFGGEGEYRALAEGLGGVRFDFRFIPDAEIATYFAACDVVLAPYRIEAQSGVALTAFHFARPVIATTVGGLPEIIEEGGNGMLVPPEDPEALARAIDRFFARADRAVMERHAAESAQRFSWAEYAGVFRGLVTGA